MAELRANTSDLRSHAGTFDAAAEDRSAASTLDEQGVETTIAAFGEINAMLHDQYRQVKRAQAAAWAANAQGNRDHADKVRQTADNYDTTEQSSAAALGTTDL